MGELSILNVGAGDVRITFDNADIAETIRAKRVIKDMLRRGFALLVEVERDGQKAYERAVDFDEKTGCYIIADFDPLEAEVTDAWDEVSKEARAEERAHGESGKTPKGDADVPKNSPKRPGKGRGRPRKKIPVAGARAVAVARSAGG